jgi:hypothetical protein
MREILYVLSVVIGLLMALLLMRLYLYGEDKGEVSIKNLVWIIIGVMVILSIIFS